jgi:RsiW-degrading membrane proteinase PrsW (M82 family)
MDYLFLLGLLILITYGLLPSFIWLLFFLKKDINPEPKRMVLKIFLYGMLSPLPILIFVLLLGIFDLEYDFFAFPVLLLTFYLLFWATAEEILKYLAVKINLKNSELDEPTDIILYMIIAGLGFAATENILVLFGAHPIFAFSDIFIIAFVRFISATFLHALCSGIIGYFLALSFFETKKRKKLFLKGIIIASLLHWLYNFAILIIGGIIGILIVITILISLFIFILLSFKKLKKMKSICKI